MSKKAKAASKDKNRIAKTARKRANRALYDSRRDSGTNSKSFRARKNSNKKKSVGKGKHLIPNCGNLGCQKCNPVDRKRQEFISVKDFIKTLTLKVVKEPRVGGSQTKKIRGGVKVAA